MALKLEPLHPLFAAQASGVRLAEPMDPATLAEIVAAMDRYAVLVFRDQPLDEDQQLAFTLQLGPFDLGFKRVSRMKGRFKTAELADISNVDLDGEVVARDHARIVNNLANQLWHSDSSFQQPAARYSLLSGHVVPEKGGQTEFADMRAAYDALPADRKADLAGRTAEHWALHSRFMLGNTQYSQEQQDAIPPTDWPIVRTHAGSGRKSLFIGVHARSVSGMTVPEGRMVLMDLLEHATQREFVYRHDWRVGDLVMWDNRCTLHRGRHFDLSARRELRRSTTLDDHTAALAAE